MKFDIISIFPEFFESPLACGITRIAQEKGAISVHLTNPRTFTPDNKVDDYQFGGGAGMVMKPEPFFKAIEKVRTKKSCLISVTPKGRPFTQQRASDLTEEEHIVIICGRYKGIDERVTAYFKPLEISLGDYILSGGEAAAYILVEAISRLLPGVLGNKDSAVSDSFTDHMLESPRYTRPGVYRRKSVPDVLRSGDHTHIARWRRKKSLEHTLQRRPELLTTETFSINDLEILLEVLNGKNS